MRAMTKQMTRRTLRLVAPALLLTGSLAACDAGGAAAPSPTTVRSEPIGTDDGGGPDAPDPGDGGPADDTPPGEANASGDPAVHTGSDPLIGSQWGLTATRMPEAWTVSGGEGVTIAVVDTGVDLDHPDLVDQLVDGIDLVDGDGVPDDPHGHGTHVAGIAAAATDNGIGGAGAAPDATIMPVRVLDADGTGDDATIAAGIDWAVDHGAGVVNLSLGESGFASRLSKGGPLNAAIRRAEAAGVVVVAAAGNDSDHKQSYRLGVPVLVVNASTPEGTAAAFTNTGDARAVSAPGVGILSTAPVAPTTLFPAGTDGYESLDGTSMAAPLVAGLAALLVSVGMSPAQVRDTIAATATNPAGDADLGEGVVDAAAALGAAPVSDGSATTTGGTGGQAAPGAPDDAPVGSGGRGAGGPGSITVALTEPVAVEAHAGDGVVCAVDGRRYRAEVAAVPATSGAAVAVTVQVVGYRGAGSYAATYEVEVTEADGVVTALPFVAPTAIADDGDGSVTVDVVGANGRRIAGSITWHC